MIGYKLVMRAAEAGCMKSACTYGYAEIVYPIGKYVGAPAWLEKLHYGPVFFSNLPDARWWMRYMNGELWRIEARCLMEPHLMPRPTNIDRVSAGQLLFDYRNGTCDADWPKGTRMASHVKLLEPIPNEQET